MGRKVLLITTDQQRYDTLGCNGGIYSRTPVVDGLAAQGIRYERAHPQSVVCMPSRSTMITGQHPSTHGVWMNGVPLPTDAPSIVEEVHRAGYSTALIGKAHFEPYMDPFGVFAENRLAAAEAFTEEAAWHDGSRGPLYGFDHMELATHGPAAPLHYSRWLFLNHPDALAGFFPVLDGDFEVSAEGGGETGAVQVKDNPISREVYHTDWVADRTIDWLEGRDQDEDWFCWMSFPDPHHPWDPPASENHRVSWRDIDLPEGYIASAAEREAVLSAKPRHWMDWYTGRVVSNFEAPLKWVPATLQADQLAEITAKNAIEVEMIDEAIGRVLATIAAKGWDDDVDIIFTTDHGELGGDFGLLFKGPYHTAGLMRLPLIWRPAPSAKVDPATVTAPVGLVDLAPTIGQIVGIERRDWMEGSALPVDDADAAARGIERTLTEWDSELFGVAVHLRTITRDGFTLTMCLPGTSHDGTEGELYDLAEDPLERVNLWDDPSRRSLRDELIDDLRRHQPPARDPRLECVAPV